MLAHCVTGTTAPGRRCFLEWWAHCAGSEGHGPSARAWIDGKVGHRQSFYARTMAAAVRSRDPFQTIMGSWLIRRLAPDSNPIEMAELPKERDDETLLHAMGAEAANVHLGSGQRTKVLADLRRRKSKWLRVSARCMANAMEREWKAFRNSGA